MPTETPENAAPDRFRLRAAELILAGRYLHDRGWVPATSGNLSARLAGDCIAITVSGRHKGQLTMDDIMRVDGSGRSLDGRKPSAEALLHASLYARHPEVNAVLHTHSPGSVLVSRLFPGGITLEGHELLKALRGITTHETRVTIPVFPNDQDIGRLAERVAEHQQANGSGYGYVIAGHGLYTWGESVAEALRHLDALEFLFDIETRLHGVKPA